MNVLQEDVGKLLVFFEKRQGKCERSLSQASIKHPYVTDLVKPNPVDFSPQPPRYLVKFLIYPTSMWLPRCDIYIISIYHLCIFEKGKNSHLKQSWGYYNNYLGVNNKTAHNTGVLCITCLSRRSERIDWNVKLILPVPFLFHSNIPGIFEKY